MLRVNDGTKSQATLAYRACHQKGSTYRKKLLNRATFVKKTTIGEKDPEQPCSLVSSVIKYD